MLYQKLGAVFTEISTSNNAPFVKRLRIIAVRTYLKKLCAIASLAVTARDAQKVQGRIKRQGAHLLEALLHPEASLTNNHAERQIRPCTVLRKITGGSRSRNGAAATARCMTVIQTLKLQHKNVAEGVRQLLTLSCQKHVCEG